MSSSHRPRQPSACASAFGRRFYPRARVDAQPDAVSEQALPLRCPPGQRIPQAPRAAGASTAPRLVPVSPPGQAGGVQSRRLGGERDAPRVELQAGVLAILVEQLKAERVHAARNATSGVPRGHGAAPASGAPSAQPSAGRTTALCHPLPPARRPRPALPAPSRHLHTGPYRHGGDGPSPLTVALHPKSRPASSPCPPSGSSATGSSSLGRT